MDYYRRHARELAAQYTSLDPEVVHSVWKHLLPDAPGLAADIGAGSGRDACWLAGLGWDVVAVEPEAAFRNAAIAKGHPRVSWLDDRMPGLPRLREMDTRFKLILVSAVWMHLAPPQRELAFRVLTDLLAPGGLLVISVRHEPDPGVREARGFYEVASQELPALARRRALVLLEHQRTADALGRETVSWETLCFRSRVGIEEPAAN
jgi:SAM-dependent methyltransferase